jgi:16S rRNA processing protein RimM
LLDGVAVTISGSRFTGNRITVRLADCSDRDQAQALRGRWLEVEIDPGERPDEPDEYYDHQLVGLQAQIGGRTVGTVAEVLHLPAHDVLAVDLDSGRQVLVPFVAQFVPVVDVEAGFLVVDPVEGLLDDAH